MSYIDIIAYFTQVHCIFVAKAELADWPIFGWLAKSGNTLFIDRQNHRDIPRVNTLIEKAIRESDGVIIFPESTSSKGSGILPFKSPLLEYAAANNFPVSYATIHYRTGPADPPAYLAVSWWGNMTFVPHFLDFLKLSRIEATITFGAATVQGEDRKTLAQEFCGAASTRSSCRRWWRTKKSEGGRGQKHSLNLETLRDQVRLRSFSEHPCLFNN